MIADENTRRAPASAPPAPGGGIEVTGLVMAYETYDGRVLALDDVTLGVDPGSSIAIVGPSGCGKSTLLGIIAGLEVPTAGEAIIGDHVVTAMSGRARAALRRHAFGFVFQSDNLQPFLTVAENVGLQCVLAGVEDDPVRRQELLDALEVGHLEHRYPDQLSGGERQRVSVARALVHKPSVLLADEPTGSLDSTNSQRAVDLLLDSHQRQGTTLVVVTHDRSVAERMDVTVELRDGRIVGNGTKVAR